MLFKLFPAFPAFLVCVVATSTLFAQERTWEDATGKYTVSGSLVQVTDGKVLLRTDDGATRLIPLNRLSQRDQAYVEAYVEDKASELPETFEAEVVNVITGDMLTISFHGNRHKIRLAGIDAPESGQAFFKQSKKHLRDLINRKTVSAVVVDRDGDTSCDLTVDSSRVDHDLLRNGFAWHDVNESSDGQRQQLEDEAKAAKRNLWSEPAAAPWQWKQWSGSERKQWVKDQEAQQLAISRRVVFGEATVSVWPARVIGISDGDTITVLNESNEQVKVRLAGIDTPEKRQPFGRKSRDAIGAILQDREVMIHTTNVQLPTLR